MTLSFNTLTYLYPYTSIAAATVKFERRLLAGQETYYTLDWRQQQRLSV